MNVRFADAMGSDLSVVNAARASFMKESAEFGEADARLIRFLARDGHESPFRHGFIRLDLRTTLRGRLLWETGLKSRPEQYRAGMVFRPTITDLLHDGYDLGEMVEWRWTASVQAVARFFHEFRAVWEPAVAEVAHAAGKRFPESIRALTGVASVGEPVRLRDAIKVPVLDKGYVRLVDWMIGPTLDESVVSFEIYAPMMVRSQWFKYVRGGDHCPPIESGNGDDGDGIDPLYARNEASRRYVTIEPEFYTPDIWRQAPEKRKQGSGGPLDPGESEGWSDDLKGHVGLSVAEYERAMENGVAPELARLFLPAYGLYTCWRWSASLPAVRHFLRQRLAEDAQAEIAEYARAVSQLVGPLVDRFGSEWDV